MFICVIGLTDKEKSMRWRVWESKINPVLSRWPEMSVIIMRMPLNKICCFSLRSHIRSGLRCVWLPLVRCAVWVLLKALNWKNNYIFASISVLEILMNALIKTERVIFSIVFFFFLGQTRKRKMRRNESEREDDWAKQCNKALLWVSNSVFLFMYAIIYLQPGYGVHFLLIHSSATSSFWHFVSHSLPHHLFLPIRDVETGVFQRQCWR